MNVELVSITTPAPRLRALGIETAEDLIVYAARVSNPSNQMNTETGKRLLRYCIKNGHWSVFETASMTVEVESSQAICEQILRHRTFTFQKFSFRYATASLGFEVYEARRQDTKNRQNSLDNMSQEDKEWFNQAQLDNNAASLYLYEQAIEKGIAKEQARFLLPLSIRTRMYMTGNVRSYLHYLDVRAKDGAGVQLEHTELAKKIRHIFEEQMPTVCNAMWGEE